MTVYPIQSSLLPRVVLILSVLVLALAACSDVDATERQSDATSVSPLGSVPSGTDSDVSPPDTRSEQAPTTTATNEDESPTTTISIEGESPTRHSLGVVGCSNTGQAVLGYTQLSSLGRLTPGELGGGSVSRWGDPSNRRYALYWGLYDQRRPPDGYMGTWLQLCLRTGEHEDSFDDTERTWVTHIVEQIQARDPGITIWISPLNFYEGVTCDAVGAIGPVIAAEASDWAATTLPGVERGPDLGPLQQSDIGVRDNCHPNGGGELLLGSQLVTFFD
jgi:hypothetical protein